MNMEVLEHTRAARSKVAIVDCDIHPALKTPAALAPYLPARWQQHLRDYGYRMRDPLGGRQYPTATPALSRRDAWPPSGGPPGSDLSFMQQQHLDPLGVEYGILQPLVPDGRDERNPGFGQAICQAMNEWQVSEWSDKDRRLKASICLPWADPTAAVAEIERNAPRKEFAQIFVQPRLQEPLGTRRYWPIYEAAAKHNLPIGMHSGGSVGSAPTAFGWLSYYAENQYAYALCMQMAVSNLIFEGVLEEFPTLRFILVESGFAWVPALGWRMDQYWSRLRSEVPHLKKPPSEYLKSNFWFTTQPMDEPERPPDILELIDWIGADKILFATDYPHWDSDDPRYAFRVALPQSLQEMVLSGNARKVFGLN